MQQIPPQVETRPCRQRRSSSFVALTIIVEFVAFAAHPAASQKYPGITLPDAASPPTEPPRQAYHSPSYTPPAPPPPRPAGPQEADPDARALADQLPLDPATANLNSRLPADVPGVIRSLGLRVPRGPRSDLRSHLPSVREFVDALRH